MDAECVTLESKNLKTDSRKGNCTPDTTPRESLGMYSAALHGISPPWYLLISVQVNAI